MIDQIKTSFNTGLFSYLQEKNSFFLKSSLFDQDTRDGVVFTLFYRNRHPVIVITGIVLVLPALVSQPRTKFQARAAAPLPFLLRYIKGTPPAADNDYSANEPPCRPVDKSARRNPIDYGLQPHPRPLYRRSTGDNCLTN